jgi:tetratricopeptide (TPR) repeat protein
VQDEAAREADRHARRGEWDQAAVHYAQAIANLERLRESEPDELAHVIELAELQYCYAEVLRHLDRVPEAVVVARASRDHYRALLSIDPVRIADRARDAQSRLGLLELMAEDGLVPGPKRVAIAQSRAAAEPGPERDLDVARQVVRQALDQPGSVELPLQVEAVAIYRRLRPLGEDDLELFGQISRLVAEALLESRSYEEAAACAADAVHAFGALAVRHPERYDRPGYEARELATLIRRRLDAIRSG